jgi:putative transposase
VDRENRGRQVLRCCIFKDLRTRGVADIPPAVTDVLKGIGDALGAVFRATTLKTCIVQLIRKSLDYANWKDRELLAAALRPAYTSASAEAAAQASGPVRA